MNKYILILSFISMTLFSCLSTSDYAEEVPLIKLSAKEHITGTYDSLFMGKIMSLFAFEDHIYMSDIDNDRILRFDSQLQFKETIARQGRGPCEVISPLHLYRDKYALYAYDPGNLRLNIYANNHSLCQSVSFSTWVTRFAIDDGQIYFSDPMQTYPISIQPLNGDSIHQFGEFIEPAHGGEIKNYNYQHLLLSSSKHLYGIYTAQPMIKKYTTQGEKLTELDLSTNNFIKSNTANAKKKIAQDPSRKKTIYNMFPDTYFYNNKLFLLTINHINGEVFCNKIFVIDCAENSLKLTQILELEDGWYQSLCVYENSLLAYNATAGELQRFDLPN